LCVTALKGCRRSAIAAGVKSESMSHSDSSCHRQSQSLVCSGDTMRAAQAPVRCTAPRGGARAPRPYLRTRLSPSVGNDGHGQSHRTGKHTHSHHLLHTPRHATRAWSVPILKREQPAASARHCPAATVLAGPPVAQLNHPTLRCVASACLEGSATARAPVPGQDGVTDGDIEQPRVFPVCFLSRTQRTLIMKGPVVQLIAVLALSACLPGLGDLSDTSNLDAHWERTWDHASTRRKQQGDIGTPGLRELRVLRGPQGYERSGVVELQVPVKSFTLHTSPAPRCLWRCS